MKRALFLWLVVIAGATTLPWSNYVGHSHWGHVRWIPFRDDPLIMGDLALNVVLFMPFGFLLWQADTVVSPSQDGGFDARLLGDPFHRRGVFSGLLP